MFDNNIIKQYKEMLYSRPDDVMQWLTEESLKNNSTATYLLAEQYSNCFFVKPDLGKKWNIMNNLMENGSVEGTIGVGYCYFRGEGIHEDVKKAAELFLRALEMEPDNYEALCVIGRMYQSGWYFEEDVSIAMDYFNKAYKNGSARAATEIAITYQFVLEPTNDNLSNSAKWLQRAADAGDPLGARRLGFAYDEMQLGLAQSDNMAFRLYLKGHEDNIALLSLTREEIIRFANEEERVAIVQELVRRAENGDATLQNELGYCYQHGNIFQHDVEKSRYWYSEALRNGDGYAGFRLGCALQYGSDGYEEDLLAAYNTFKEGGELGEPLAMKALADLLSADISDNLKDVFPDRAVQSLYWYEKAAETGDKDAAFNCALIYGYGNHYPIPKDNNKAAFYYRISAADGCNRAYLPLVELIVEGGLESPDYKEAQHYISMILNPPNNGTPVNTYEMGKAEYLLGKMYESGLGVTKNIEEAIKHYRNSVTYDVQEGKEVLKSYKKTLFGWKKV